MRLPFLTPATRASAGCPSCGNAVDADQLACIECGALLRRERRLATAAWRAPVVLVASLLLLLATGFGFASGAVKEDGEVTVAEAPPPAAAPPAPPSEGAKPPEASGLDSELPALPKPGEAGGGDDLALDPKDLGGKSSGSGLGSGADDGGRSGSGGSGLSDGGGSSGDRGRSEPPPPNAPSLRPAPKVTLTSWPALERSTYAVVLKTSRTRAAAEREARSAASDGLRPAGVVASSKFANQPSGRFIAFVGQPFSSREDAERFLGNTVEPEGYTATVLFLDGAGTGPTG